MNEQQKALWARLFIACKNLRKLKPWEFWTEDDIILIEDPKTKVMGYCIIKDDIMTESLSIEIYCGLPSLHAHFDVKKHEEIDFSHIEDMDYIKSKYRQDGFMLIYADRQELFKEDYELIKEAGMGFRGKGQWPILRRLYPGSRPWLIESDDDVRLLTLYLEQLYDVFQQQDDGKPDYQQDAYYTLKQENNVWQLSYTKHDELLMSVKPLIYPNDLKVHRVKKLRKQASVLEGNQFYVPTPLWDEELNREAYPLITTFVDHTTGEVYCGDVIKSTREELEQISDTLAELLLNRLNFRPREIIVSDDTMYGLLSDFCQKADITCRVGSTPMSEEFMNHYLGDQGQIPEDIEEGMFQLLQASEQVYEVMLETNCGQKLNSLQKTVMKDVWMYSVLFLAQECLEFPGEWTKEGFELLLQSHILEDSLKPEYYGMIGPAIKNYLDCLQELGMIKNSFVLGRVLTKYY